MNNLLILIILSIILFFTLDSIHTKYIKNKVDDKFQNIEGSYEKFKSLDYEDFEDEPTTTTTISELSNDDKRELYYKQYIYKILSANDKDQIIKLNLSNSEEKINLDFIFNNVLDHEKISEYGSDFNTAVIQNYDNMDNETIYNIDKINCNYEDNESYDINDYRWNIENITDTSFTLLFTNLYDEYNNMDIIKTYKVIFTIKDNYTIQSLYSLNVSFKELLSPNIINSITLIVNDDTNEILTNYYVNQILFSNFTVKRLEQYHLNMTDTIENELLQPSYNNIRRHKELEENINKLENYYRFKKNMTNTYSNYKTLDN